MAHKLAAPAAVILTYHSIQDRPEQYANTIGCDCIHATSIFEWQMEFIARRFSAVNMDDIWRFLKGEKNLPPRAVAITFDDGFKDNVRVAAPILNRFGIPGTFYVLIGSVDQSKAPWYCLLRHAFFTSRNSKWTDPFSGTIRDLTDSEAREGAFVNTGDLLVQVADFFKGSNLIIGTKRRIEGLTLQATDTTWSHGTGPGVSGPMLPLVMAMTGRPVADGELTGEGAATLRARSSS